MTSTVGALTTIYKLLFNSTEMLITNWETLGHLELGVDASTWANF